MLSRVYKNLRLLSEFILWNRHRRISINWLSDISEIDPGAQVILYGSTARGDAWKDSDCDILVLTDYPLNNRKEKTFRDHLHQLELESGESLSIFVYSKQDWNSKQKASPYYQNVTQEGIRLWHLRKELNTRITGLRMKSECYKALKYWLLIMILNISECPVSDGKIK